MSAIWFGAANVHDTGFGFRIMGHSNTHKSYYFESKQFSIDWKIKGEKSNHN